MKPQKLTLSKNKAQAMVEFAVALPILLMLVYGLLEVGRLLFTYSSVVNATRQAVRWGSTTGSGDGGVPGNTVAYPRYQDCAGIRASAQRGDYLNVFNNNNIHIYYDDGPTDLTPTEYCIDPASSDNSLTSSTLSDNKHRIKISIDYQFKAIIPKLVPFQSSTKTATSARTIVTSISISGGSAPGPSKESTTIVINSDLPDPSYIGQNVAVTVTVTGDSTTPTGTVDITGADTNCSITLSSGTGSCNVVFNSVGTKTITATYNGDSTHDGSGLVNTTHTVILAPTTTTITSDTPDPSATNGTVNVNVTVSSVWGTPTGTVTITGANTNCTLTLTSGSGNCLVTFTSAGSKTITATYSGDTVHDVSSDTEAHTVAAPTAGPSPTATKTAPPAATPTFTSTPTPAVAVCAIDYQVTSSWGNNFQVNLTITNSSSTTINGWTLTWSYTAGQAIYNLWNANWSQNGGSVITTNPNNYNNIISPNGGSVSFGFQGTFNGTNPLPINFSLNGSPCSGGGVPSTATPTRTFTPTVIPTNITCAQITHGPLTISAASMTMLIHNSTTAQLVVQNVVVTWNHDKGQQGNKPLQLQSATLNSVKFWEGGVTSSSYTIYPTSLNIPPGDSIIAFNFDYSYYTKDNSEQIYINISNPGCGFIDSKH